MRDESLDFITVAHLFEHIVNPFDALREWDRVLKPGGFLIMAMPDQNKLNTIVMDYTHVHGYTPESISDLLSSCGWEVVECGKVSNMGSFGVVARKNRGPICQ